MTAAPYATADEARAYEAALSSPDTFTDAYLEDLVAEFELVAEDYMGVAYAVRDAVDTVPAANTSRVLVLKKWPVIAISSFTVDGVPFASTNYTLNTATGVVTYGGYWSRNYPMSIGGVLVITYTYGYSAPPSVLKRACLEYVRAVALQRNSGVGRDIVYQSMDGMTTRYSTPDLSAGRPTGYIEIDRILNTLKQRPPAVA